MGEVKRYTFFKPTLQTRYHIDFNWWQQNDRDWRVYLQNNLCPEHREAYADYNAGEMIDWVDPNTAEVQQVDGLQHILITHCAKQDGFITERSALVDSVFRVFLANGNIPLSALELGERLGRPPDIILKTFSGLRVYKGIRPCME